MISVAMATTTIAAGKVDPETVGKGMLTALNNQVGLSADQRDKAEPIIDKHVAALEAVKNDTTGGFSLGEVAGFKSTLHDE